MPFEWSFCAVLVLATALASGARSKSTEDSFDKSFEDSSSTNQKLGEDLEPTKDAFLGFVNGLVNTGFASSKIALNRIGKESEKRRHFGEQLERFLASLPTYNSEIPVVDQMPRALENPNKPTRLRQV